MKLKDDFTVKFEGKSYSIDIEKFCTVLSVLENKDVNLRNTKEIEDYMNKYGLYDSYFLDKVSF